MSAHPQEPELAELALETGPGHLLRSAREQAEYSINEVAGQLHLDIKTVELLERDEFDELPAPTFVRGYLRAYARLLGLPADPVVNAFDQRGLSPPALVADIAKRPQAHTSDFSVRIFTYMVVAGLVALMALWWHSQQSNLSSDAAEVVVPEAPAVGDDAIAATDIPLVTNDNTDVLQTNDAAQTAEPQSASEDSALEPSGGLTGLDSALSLSPEQGQVAGAQDGTIQSTPPIADAGDSGAASAEVAGDAASAAAAAELAASAPSAGTGAGILLMEFSGESWVEVYDAGGSRLFYDMVKSGDEVSMDNQGEISVVIGNPGSASVQYGGSPIELAPRGESGVARFKVGG